LLHRHKKKLPQENSHVRDSTIISPYVTSYYFQHLPVTLHCEKSEEEEKEEERRCTITGHGECIIAMSQYKAFNIASSA
jgi:hypothetical protein